MADLVEKLKELGFNSYEAKVYIALLKKHPATGYEVTKLANIPQSRTYDTLKILEQKNIVTINSSNPLTYTPVKPKVLLSGYQKKIASTVNYLEKHLPDVKEKYNEPIITITEEREIENKIKEVINNSKKEIYVECWAQDFKIFEQDFLNAYNRNVEIRIVGYDNFNSTFGLVFRHAYARDIELSLGGRMFILVSDNCESIIYQFPSTSEKQDNKNLIWSKNTAIAFIIKEFIVHDMFLTDIEENLVEQMKYIYGRGFKRLKDKVLGSSPDYLIH